MIYRHPYSTSHPVSENVFFCVEFTDCLECIVMCKEPLIGAGDLNFHMDEGAKRFVDILARFCLYQHVDDRDMKVVFTKPSVPTD